MRLGTLDVCTRVMGFHHRLDLFDPLLRNIDREQDLALFDVVFELLDLGIRRIHPNHARHPRADAGAGQCRCQDGTATQHDARRREGDRRDTGKDAGHATDRQAAPLILIGDAFHNFVDGVVIAAAFLTSVPLGVATAIAVIAHEVPQAIGDFAILLESGYSKSRALVLNTLSAVTTLPGAILAYFWLAEAQSLVPYVLAQSAARFIYIATADLVPNLHRKVNLSDPVIQVILLIAGITTIAFLKVAHG